MLPRARASGRPVLESLGGGGFQQFTSLAGLLAFIGRSPETEMARTSTAAAKDKDKEDCDGKK